MKTITKFLFKGLSTASYVSGILVFVLGMLYPGLPFTNVIAQAGIYSPVFQEPAPTQACAVPPGYEDTLRLWHRTQVSHTWEFSVDQPSHVVLEFIYFQDYTSEGCPYDCSVDNCQLNEIGEGTTPFGDWALEDNYKGPNSGRKILEGDLNPGTYEASFRVTSTGSLSIGLYVRQSPLPTATQPVTNPTAAPETPEPTSTEVPPADTATATPTATDVPPPTETPTATHTPTVEVPATDTPTATQIPPAEDTPTPTGVVLPTVFPTETEAAPTATTAPGPGDTPVPTATQSGVVSQLPTRTPQTGAAQPSATSSPPPTLPPPGGLGAVTQTPQVLVPQTGADLTGFGDFSFPLPSGPMATLGIGLIGLGLVLHGLSRKLSEQ